MTEEESWSAHRLLILKGLERLESSVRDNQRETVSLIGQATREADDAHTRLRHDLEVTESKSDAQHQVIQGFIREIQGTLATIQAERKIEKEQMATRSTYLTIGISVALNAAWEIIRGWAHRT